MPASGPILLGAASNNNATSLSFRPSASVATASMLWVVGITTVADTADLTIADQAGNGYLLQIFAKPDGSSAAIFAAWTLITNPLGTNQNITITSSIRGPFAVCAVAYSGVQASLSGITSSWFNTTSPVLRLPSSNPGNQLLAMIVVNGPNTDLFTQDLAFSADIGSGLGNASLALHGGGAPSPNGGPATYAPVLGTLRQSLGFLAAFA